MYEKAKKKKKSCYNIYFPLHRRYIIQENGKQLTQLNQRNFVASQQNKLTHTHLDIHISTHFSWRQRM